MIMCAQLSKDSILSITLHIYKILFKPLPEILFDLKRKFFRKVISCIVSGVDKNRTFLSLSEFFSKHIARCTECTKYTKVLISLF